VASIIYTREKLFEQSSHHMTVENPTYMCLWSYESFARKLISVIESLSQSSPLCKFLSHFTSLVEFARFPFMGPQGIQWFAWWPFFFLLCCLNHMKNARSCVILMYSNGVFGLRKSVCRLRSCYVRISYSVLLCFLIFGVVMISICLNCARSWWRRCFIKANSSPLEVQTF